MSGKRYTEEFRIAAVKQLTEGGHSVGDFGRNTQKPQLQEY